MKKVFGTHNRLLEIDLSSRKVTEGIISEKDRADYLGAKGIGLKLLYDRLETGIDPLCPDNMIIFTMGVMMGTGAPCSGRFSAVSKSPQTGLVFSSSCGGRFGMAFKTAGYDALILKGRSKAPIVLEISSNGVEFKPAKDLRGLDLFETQERIDLGMKDGVLAIGPAGENKVLFANIASGHRFFGRGGLGAILGSKNVKAIVARGGDYLIRAKNGEKFDKVKKKALKYIDRNEMTGKLYSNYGTRTNVAFSNSNRILPVNNFSRGSDERAKKVEGKFIKDVYHPEKSTCKPCMIFCGQRTNVGGKRTQIPEYESLIMLGPNLGIFDTDMIIELNETCGKMGLDTITMGLTLSYVMEAAERGLIKTKIKFGDPARLSNLICDTAHKRGFGKELAEGSKRLSEKYGGEEFAMHVKGLELAAYDPRGSWGQGLSYAVANRGGCHLSASMFALEPFFKFLTPRSTRAKAHFVKYFENLYAANNSLQLCHFTSFAFIMETPLVRFVPRWLIRIAMMNLPVIASKFLDISIFSRFYAAVLDVKLSQTAFLKAGARVHLLERFMNTREGVSKKDDTLPGRLLNEAVKEDNLKPVPLEKMRRKYYRIRGWDRDGIPKAKTLKKYNIEY